MLMTQRLDHLPSARLVAPQLPRSDGPTSLDDHGRGVHPSAADYLAQQVLCRFAASGNQTLIVEDDLARRGDPGLQEAAFVGDRVLRWRELGVEAKQAVRLLRSGASGYPLIAYVCRGASADVGLEAGTLLDSKKQAALVDSTVAILVTVYDAEAYLLLMSHDWEALLS